MTGVELERAAAAIVTPAAAGGLCLVTDEQQRHRVAFVIAGRGKAAVGPSFAKPRDAARFMDLLAGDVPTPRSGQTTAPVDMSGNSSAGQSGAPDGQSFAAGALCVGCGKPVPLGRRGQRRLTHGPACRQLARRHHTFATSISRRSSARPTGESQTLTPQG